MVKKKAKKATKAAEKKAGTRSECSWQGQWYHWVVSEFAFYGFFYLLLYYVGVVGGIWYKALFLFALMNISIIACPVMRSHHMK